MKNLYSDNNQSENRKDGMKYITSSVYNIIKTGDGVTYNYICENIPLENKKTLHRRIYDVLNVMKADMKSVFEYLVIRNSQAQDEHKDKLFLPFMIIKTQTNSVIHCDTNEERSFFTFKSSEEIELVEDLDILKELYITENKVSIRRYPRKDSLDHIYF
ncbi:hypothetical protein P3W45_001400 [Vairimorpha bombi]